MPRALLLAASTLRARCSRDTVMGDERSVSIAKRPRARKRRYYAMGPDYSVGSRPGYWLEDKSILPPYEVFRLPASTGRAPFVFDKSVGSLPYDLEPYYRWWLISDRTKAVLERLDPEAFVFVPCDVRVPHGSYRGPHYWLCDVVRVLDALDESQSCLTIRIENDARSLDFGKKVYMAMPGSKLVFTEAEIGKAHIFRMAHSEADVICDQDLKDACKSAGLKRIRFRDASKL
ncbi:hypothetical protein B5V03_34080 [Bradyrhizobium betae]|uniref:Immunity MXAN-0049 protein domain-containing protein n=2 Tax=Bradyrhizobium betae TaxID=244734 RepID=A0A4Q1UQL4_9BRAD|nr:hypothetical protein B5V03_34080 [Bradyrhizobium betae]